MPAARLKTDEKGIHKMTHDDISHAIHEEIISNEDDPDVMRSKIKTMLADLPDDDETIGAVIHEAKMFAAARHEQFRILDDDMERVVGMMDGGLEPMIAWLEAKGRTDARQQVFGRKWWTER
jgi:hypothetical protein